MTSVEHNSMVFKKIPSVLESTPNGQQFLSLHFYYHSSRTMGPSTQAIEWIFLLTRLRHRLASPSMLLHKSKACEKAASVDSRAYHTEACSQKIFGFNDIFPYGEGLPVLNRNSQLKHGEFHKNSAPRKQRPIRSWSRWPHAFCNPRLISWSTCHQWRRGQLHLCDPLVVILEDNTHLHISTHWSASVLMRGGSATSFPSYFSLPRKGAFIAVWKVQIRSFSAFVLLFDYWFCFTGCSWRSNDECSIVGDNDNNRKAIDPNNNEKINNNQPSAMAMVMASKQRTTTTAKPLMLTTWTINRWRLQEQNQQTAKARHCRRWQETPETTEKNELSRINRRQRQEQQQATEAWHRRRCLEDGYNNCKANNAYKHEK